MTPSFALFILDALLLALVWPLTVWLGVSALGEGWVWFQALIYVTSNLFFLYALGLYRREAIADTRKGLQRVPLVISIVIVFGTFVIAATGLMPSPALALVAVVCFTGCATLARLGFAFIRRYPFFRPHVLVIGAGKRAWDLMWILRSQGRSLHYDLTFVHDEAFGDVDPRLERDPTISIMHASGSLLEIAERVRADQIVLAHYKRQGKALEGLITCRTFGYPVFHYMSFLEREVHRIDIKRLDLRWVLYSAGFNFGPLGQVLKRILDIAISLSALIFLSPMLLLAMLAVWLGDGGTPLYQQERVTRGGRTFKIRKLRTMKLDSEKKGAVWAASEDKRITRVGKFLRRSRMDEIPQLFNVLVGEMSLVGPRPERPEFVEMLARDLPLYKERHAVKAGITGWAQINYPYGASIDDARSKLSYDLYYVKNCSIFLDLLIMTQTLRVVLWPGSGAR
jgi:sugar transferase (PEP-CTERM system associated)